MVLSFSPSTPKLVNFPHFLTCTSLRKTCQHQKFEKKHVNTKTGPFSQFFDLHLFEKNMSTPKLVNFHHFLDSRSLRQKHVNTKTSQFSPFFGFQEFEKNMSTQKLVNFHHFWIPGVWEKHVNTKTSQFSPLFGFQEFEKNMSTPKLVNFPHGSKMF